MKRRTLVFAEKSEEISAISARKCRYRKKITKMSVSDKQITKKGKNLIYIGKKVIHNKERKASAVCD